MENSRIKDQKVLQTVRSQKEMYVIFSECTKMPYVVCDPETYDDEILIYFNVAGGLLYLQNTSQIRMFNLQTGEQKIIKSRD